MSIAPQTPFESAGLPPWLDWRAVDGKIRTRYLGEDADPKAEAQRAREHLVSTAERGQVTRIKELGGE